MAQSCDGLLLKSVARGAEHLRKNCMTPSTSAMKSDLGPTDWTVTLAKLLILPRLRAGTKVLLGVALELLTSFTPKLLPHSGHPYRCCDRTTCLPGDNTFCPSSLHAKANRP